MMKRKRGQVKSVACKKPKLSNGVSCHAPPSTQHPVLNLYYPHVSTLGNLIRYWLPSTSRARRRRLDQFDTDYPEHATFLSRIVVGYKSRPVLRAQDERRNQLVAFTQTQRAARGDSLEQRVCNLEEIVDFAIWTLFHKGSASAKAPNHVLCHGYHKSATIGENHTHMPILQLPGIIQRDSNSNVQALKQSPWTDVANLLGKDAEAIMLSLLLDCSIFQQLSTGEQNLYQVSGQPISSLTLQPVFATARSATTRACSTTPAAKPGCITFARNRMFHARPSISGKGNVQLGLKRIHILNRYGDITDPMQEICVMQYIFPRQFGLHNVFTSKANSPDKAQQYKDYTIRDQEIMATNQDKPAKIPRRLRGPIQNLVQRIRANHHHCSYTQLLRHHCPVEESAFQSNFSSYCNQISSSTMSARVLTQSQRPSLNPLHSSVSHTPHSTSLIPHATPTRSVAAFCCAVLLQLLPRDILGTSADGSQNWKKLLRSVDRFITMRRFESTTVHDICHGIKINSIDWLRPRGVRNNDKLSIHDAAKRMEILQEMMFYIFDSILMPLVRSNFYVTETAVHRYRMFYFRHDVWKKLVEPSLGVMRLSMFESLKTRQLQVDFRTRNLGYSQMRLLPKEHGVRPLMNLKKKTIRLVGGRQIPGQSINQQLTSIFGVLNFERYRRPEILASAMFSIGELQNRLTDFKQRLDSSCQQKLFFVKVDVQSCFDTIPQKELLASIDRVLLDNEYRIVKHTETKRISASDKHTSGRAIASYVSRATVVNGPALLSLQAADGLGERRRKRIYTAVDFQRTIALSQVRKVLADHLQHNVVRYGRKHFKQVRGIPQGSILSTLLCNLFYGQYEREELDFLDPSVSLLLRLTDDFLLITTAEEQARQFLRTITRHNPKYGISVNAEKSLVNFEICIEGRKVPRLHGGERLAYCGMIIDTHSLQISKNRQAKDTHVENGITVGNSKRAGTALQSKTLSSLQRQFHAMLLDGALNSRGQVLSSIFECLVETGMKMHRHIKSLAKHKRPSQAFLISTCDRMVDAAYKMVHRGRVYKPVVVTRAQISWLVAAALSRVLERKQSDYPQVLRWLLTVERMQRKSMNMATWDLEGMVEKCMTPFADYVY